MTKEKLYRARILEEKIDDIEEQIKNIEIVRDRAIDREKYTDVDCFTIHIRLFDLENLKKVTAVAVECLEESLEKYKKEFEEL